MIKNYKHCNCGKYRKCQSCYKANLHFANGIYNKIKNEKWWQRSGLMIKLFDLEMIVFGRKGNETGSVYNLYKCL